MSLSCMSQLRIDGAQSIGSVQAVAKNYMEQHVAKLAVPLCLSIESGIHVIVLPTPTEDRWCLKQWQCSGCCKELHGATCSKACSAIIVIH